MLIQIGQVEAILRYPVKSMGEERLDVADIPPFRDREKGTCVIETQLLGTPPNPAWDRFAGNASFQTLGLH